MNIRLTFPLQTTNVRSFPFCFRKFSQFFFQISGADENGWSHPRNFARPLCPLCIRWPVGPGLYLFTTSRTNAIWAKSTFGVLKLTCQERLAHVQCLPIMCLTDFVYHQQKAGYCEAASLQSSTGRANRKLPTAISRPIKATCITLFPMAYHQSIWIQFVGVTVT